MAIVIRAEVLNRIIIGKNLLDLAGLPGPNSSPLTVGLSVLLAHDAADLVFAGLADSLGIPFNDAKGKPKYQIFLMEYVHAIEQQKPGLALSSFFNQLNTARNSFKHRGISPSPHQFYASIPETRRKLDEACQACIGKSLDELNLEELIENDRVVV